MKTALVAVLALACGLAAGLLLRPVMWPTAAQQTANTSPAPATSPATPTANGAPETPQNNPRKPNTPNHPAGSGTAQSANDLLARAIAAIEAETPRQQGNGVITGRVRLKSGAPLAGVTITAQGGDAATPALATHASDSAKSPGGAASDPTAVLQGLMAARALCFTTVTGADGTFTLANLPDTRFKVTPSLGDYFFEAVGEQRQEMLWRFFGVQPASRLADVRTGATLDILAHPRFRVDFDVLLPDGTRPPWAMINFPTTDDESRRYWRWRPEAPSHPVGTGVLWLSAFFATPDGRDYTTSDFGANCVVEADSPPRTVVIRLLEVVTVKGAFVFAGVPRRLNVRLCPYSGEATPPTGGGSGWRDATADLYGQVPGVDYWFRDVTPGKWWLYAMEEGDADTLVASRIVVVGSASVRADLSIPNPDTVTIRSVDPAGKILPDVGLELRRRDSGPGDFSSATALDQPDGSRALLRPAIEEAADGSITANRWVVRGFTPRYGYAEAEFDARTTAPVELRFVRAASLDVVVEGKTQQELISRGPGGIDGVYQLRLSFPENPQLFGEYGEYNFLRSGSPWAADDRRYEGLAPGRYTIRIESRKRALITREVVLTAGENRVVIPFPKLYELHVRFPGGGAETACLWADDKEARQNPDDRSNKELAVFSGVPEGPCLLFADVDDVPRFMRIDIPRQLDVVFFGEDVTAMRVRIADPREAKELASLIPLRDGDLILSVNSKSISAAMKSEELFSEENTEPLLIEIERAGRRETVTTTGKAFHSAKKSGMEFLPALR
jgi:hypothetical protein